ncbi:hypothetical protein cyc_07374 [Cyclospora cayetanensis]|nr:hypothetical protein cyc_07374 [Cyclospora cayetanensis]
MEARCSRLFERLHEITDSSRAFCSSCGESDTEATEGATQEATGATTDAAPTARKPSGPQRKAQKVAVDPARLEEQHALLQQLQQLFQEIDTAFSSNKPAHVSVMIRCCNALLRADGLAVLKACADCQPLHNAAQSIIETVVPCIWAT